MTTIVVEDQNIKHIVKMKEIISWAWCRTCENYCLNTQFSKVYFVDFDPQSISIVELFKFYPDESLITETSRDCLLMECMASKTVPEIQMRITLPYHEYSEINAYKIANAINRKSSCPVSVANSGRFQVNAFVSFCGYYDTNEPDCDSPWTQTESTKNCFANLLSTAESLYKIITKNRL